MVKKIYKVVLHLAVEDKNYSPPDQWPWDDLLDMPWEDVVLQDVKEL